MTTRAHLERLRAELAMSRQRFDTVREERDTAMTEVYRLRRRIQDFDAAQQSLAAQLAERARRLRGPERGAGPPTADMLSTNA